MPRFEKRRWLWIGGAVVVASFAVFVASRGSGDRHVELAREARVNVAGFRRVCPAGAPLPTRGYDLRRTFAGLKLTSRRDLCIPAAPAGATVASGPSEAVGYLSLVYGSCTPTSSDGCVPPLNVQSWPECARDPNSYRPSDRRAVRLEATLNPSEPKKIPTAPWVPAREFESGMRLEIYSGDTTIVVFAADTHLADAAGAALARAAAEQAPPGSAVRLRSALRQPGDASTCRHRLPIRPRREQ